MENVITKNSLENAVLKLRDWETILQEKRQQLDEMKADFEEANRELLSDISEAKDVIEDIKHHVREAATDRFLETGEKKLFGGIGIREKKLIAYDEKKAFEFAKEKEMFLSFDKKAFEKAAPSLGLDFVELTTEPQVTFPKEIKV